MSDINVGSRLLIRNADGKVIGNFLPSRKHLGKTTLTLLRSDGTTHTTVRGEKDWAQVLELHPEWCFAHSFYVVKCHKDENDVVVELEHNSVAEWCSTFRVVHTYGWQNAFLTSFRAAMIPLGRETHIGNFVDLTV